MRHIKASVALGALALFGQASIGNADAASARPGCRAAHPAVAHHASGAVVKPQPVRAPIPCGTGTGFAGGESAIAVTNSGAVFYAPAVQTFAGTQTQYFLGGNSGFARSTDLGASWSFVNPISAPVPVPPNPAGEPGFPAWDQIDDKFFMDRSTGRLFWADPDIPSEAVLWTDDDGRTWGISELPVGFGGEWTQVTTARPRTSRPSGYPKVVYACGEYDSVGRDVTTELEGDLCQKSLDGGQTWVVAGQGFFGSPSSTHPQCNGQSEHPNFSPWAAPDSQGRLYELLFCGGHAFLIRSDDEGASWQVAARVPYAIPNAGPGATGSAELRTDAADNLYLAWSVPGNPNPNGSYQPGVVEMAISRNGGSTWTHPLDVLAPGVAGIRTHFGFDVGKPGHVAISYLGHSNARAGFDGYITETHDALARRPLFWSAPTNDRSEAPLDSGGKGSSNGLGLDYVSVAIGPDDTPWASFWDACGEDLPQRDPACPAARNPSSTTTLGFMDFAGRLAVPAAASPPRASRLVHLPAASRCVSPRGISLRVRKRLNRTSVKRATIFVGRRRVRTVTGSKLNAPIRIRLTGGGRFRLRVVLLLGSGRRVGLTRSYHRCAHGAVRFTG